MRKQNKEQDAAKRLETFLCSGLVLYLQEFQTKVEEELDAIQDVIEKKASQSAKKKNE